MGDGIKCTEHIEALTAGRSADELAHETPQKAEIRR
jgi:hypothetical protein